MSASADNITRSATALPAPAVASPMRRVWRRAARPGLPLRIAVIGSDRCADALEAELRFAGIEDCVIVGRIATTDDPDPRPSRVPVLGRLGALRAVVSEHRIGLLVISGEMPAVSIFDEAVATCMHLQVRICTVTYFYESVFGHVRMAEINATWFQCVMHPRYRASSPYKAVMDLVGALLLGLLLLPLLALLATVIARDGGPVLFKQTRIGEGGRPFVLYKLRTMRADVDSAAQWAAPDDPRVTPIGRILRRTHIDELPQFLNVLRGEMSLVGPRPEQPEFVDRLEKTLPFYQRRHLIRPGITGWAQVRCGYANSDLGSAWKLCHDLYYMKYRSFRFDLTIIVKTLWGLLVRPKAWNEATTTALVPAPAVDVSDDTTLPRRPIGAAPAVSHTAAAAFTAVNSSTLDSATPPRSARSRGGSPP
jgi:exopolysaccharide biosynthesis polyprenyl glycosylphosphotransferase